MDPVLIMTEGAGGGLSTIGTVVTQAWTWFTGVVTTANANPVMWVPVAFGIAGASVGLLRRATRVGGRRK